MKVRTLIVSILGILIILSVSQAQNARIPEQELSFETQTVQTSGSKARRLRQQNAEQYSQYSGVPLSATPTLGTIPTKMRIIELRHITAVELADMIMNVFRIEVYPDRRLNRLIVNATDEQTKSIMSLVEAMDVADPEASTPRDVQNLVYRIYMFETSSGDEGMKPFSTILRTSARVSPQELLDAVEDKDLRISEFLQSNDLDEPQGEILIQGKAASNESLKRVVEKFPKSHILELKWDDDETFTNNIAAAQYTQLPDQMQKHIRKFLGDKIRTVGYWFGNSSVPGDIEAPIGPWRMNLRFDVESDGMLELRVEVEMPGEMHHFDRRLGREQSDEILSNTIRAKIGKPIIIGYNRESYGTRRMGAMVIIPEADMIQLGDIKK